MLELEVTWEKGEAANKICAIKFIRRVFDFGLKEAKDFTECGGTGIYEATYNWFSVQIDDDSKALRFMLEYRKYGFRVRNASYVEPKLRAGWVIQ